MSDFNASEYSSSYEDPENAVCYPDETSPLDFPEPAHDPNTCYPGDEPLPPLPQPSIPQFDGVTPAQGTTNRPGHYVDAPLQGTEASRSGEMYTEAIDQFAVEHNSRYAQNQQGKGETYCNIFASDVTRAMGAEIPHRIDAQGNPVDTGGNELNANDTVHWLHQHGGEHGWHQVSAEEAQKHANEGHPAVAVWDNPKGIGHEMVVRPEDDTHHANRDAQGHITDPLIAQAGAKNKEHTHVGEIIKSPSQVEYWEHD